ncbi:MAG: carboxypeptidase regulatory-like domain-containing protein [Planctomycetota bacterium]|nr:MAG: carboxypeptidase regulatory-like domain-containing protein [Planctomycetota bacterium]
MTRRLWPWLLALFAAGAAYWLFSTDGGLFQNEVSPALGSPSSELSGFGEKEGYVLLRLQNDRGEAVTGAACFGDRSGGAYFVSGRESWGPAEFLGRSDDQGWLKLSPTWSRGFRLKVEAANGRSSQLNVPPWRDSQEVRFERFLPSKLEEEDKLGGRNLRGQVVDSKTQAGIPGVRVKFQKEGLVTAFSDENGFFLFEGLPARPKNLPTPSYFYVRAEGYVQVAIPYAEDAPIDGQWQISLSKGARLNGKVLSEKPVDWASATVFTYPRRQMSHLEFEEFSPAKIDRQGSFTVAGLRRRQSYFFLVVVPGVGGASYFSRASQQDESVTLNLLPFATIQGKFPELQSLTLKLIDLKSQGLPIPASHHFGLFGNPEIELAAGRDGTIHLNQVHAGTYRLQAPDSKLDGMVLQIEPGQFLDLNKELLQRE